MLKVVQTMIYKYVYMWEQETSVCMCCTVIKKPKKHKVCLINNRILLILSHVRDWWNPQCLQFIYLYNITNTVTIMHRENFTKETNNL